MHFRIILRNPPKSWLRAIRFHIPNFVPLPYSPMNLVFCKFFYSFYLSLAQMARIEIDELIPLHRNKYQYLIEVRPCNFLFINIFFSFGQSLNWIKSTEMGILLEGILLFFFLITRPKLCVILDTIRIFIQIMTPDIWYWNWMTKNEQNNIKRIFIAGGYDIIKKSK